MDQRADSIVTEVLQRKPILLLYLFRSLLVTMATVAKRSTPSSFHISSKTGKRRAFITQCCTESRRKKTANHFRSGPTYSTPLKWSLPQSHWEPLCHPLEQEVSKEVDGYFLEHWPFPDDKARKKFLAAGFSRVTCYYFPKALDDRIHFACRLLTVLFLIDGPLLPIHKTLRS